MTDVDLMENLFFANFSSAKTWVVVYARSNRFFTIHFGTEVERRIAQLTNYFGKVWMEKTFLYEVEKALFG